jgi:hypothetical protein
MFMIDVANLLREDGERAGRDGRVLGDEDFVSEILTEADDRLKRQLSISKRHDVMHRVSFGTEARGGRYWSSRQELPGD